MACEIGKKLKQEAYSGTEEWAAGRLQYSKAKTGKKAVAGRRAEDAGFAKSQAAHKVLAAHIAECAECWDLKPIS